MSADPNYASTNRSYRWVVAWLVAGAVLALLLLANSIRDYVFVSQLLIAQQVRHIMSQRVASFEQKARSSWKPGDSRLALLSDLLKDDHPFWIVLRDGDGRTLEQQGEPPRRFFTPSEEESHFRLHEALFQSVSIPSGKGVVEAFAVHVPILIPPPAELPRPAAGATVSALPPPPGPRSILIVEIALPLKATDSSILAPQWQNLVINCSGALALLATVVIAGFGFRSYARGKKLEEQLAIAHEVQSALLPSLPESCAGVQLATEYRPAEQVGGDFFDAFPVNNGGLAMVLGDVSGKGVPAALLVGVIHGAVRSSAWAESTAQHEHETASLNQLLCERASGERYASMFWCYYEPAQGSFQLNGVLHYVNAGHCPPLLVSQVEGGRVVALEEGGPVLGLLPAAAYRQESQPVEAGDVLVMYSDGLLEATNTAGEEYGDARLRALLAANRGNSPEQIKAAIVESVTTFLARVPLQDDLTLLVAKFG